MLVAQAPAPMENASSLSESKETASKEAPPSNAAYEIYAPHVDKDNIPSIPESPSIKKQSLKTFSDINTLLQAGKKKEGKVIIRESQWPLNTNVRPQLWPALCNQHVHGKGMMDGFYWEMIGQIMGSPGTIISLAFTRGIFVVSFVFIGNTFTLAHF